MRPQNLIGNIGLEKEKNESQEECLIAILLIVFVSHYAFMVPEAVPVVLPDGQPRS
jgi:hypothetical protein